MMNKRLLIPAAAVLSLPVFFGCSGNGGAQGMPDMSHLPDYVAGISISVYNNDTAAFASMVQYPLSRPYPLHDIADSAQMVAYYPVMVDDSLRSMALDGATGWSEFGWRGWALDDGKVWVDEEGIYDIPYMSATEKKNYAALVEREMATLPPDLRNGYVPVGCFRESDGQAVYRIDRKEGSDSYRLAVYGKGALRNSAPDRLLVGRMVTEGSALSGRYEFSGGGVDAVLIPEPVSEGDVPSVSFSDINGGDGVGIVPVYWLDLVR